MTAASTPDVRIRSPHGLKVTTSGDAAGAVIRLEGELDMASAALAHDAFSSAFAQSTARVAVDLRGLSFLDSTGIHALMRLRDRCREAVRDFAVVLNPGPVHRTLEVCGLLDELGYIPQEAAAA